MRVADAALFAALMVLVLAAVAGVIAPIAVVVMYLLDASFHGFTPGVKHAILALLVLHLLPGDFGD